MSYLLLITGLPATGKTSFAKYLSKEIKIPMVSKDIIKEHLFDTVGFKNKEEKYKLGIAAMDIMYHFTEIQLGIGQSVILENNFENVSKTDLIKIIEKYKCKTILVKFYADMDVLFKRFLKRDKSPDRHRGHVINTQYPEVKEGEALSVASQNISPAEFQRACEQRGMTDFFIGTGEVEILVDTTDFSKILYDAIINEIKENL